MAVIVNQLLNSGLDYTGFLRYDSDQTLTEEQKTRVRQSIHAASLSEVTGMFTDLTTRLANVASLFYANTIADRDLLGPAITGTPGARAFIYVADATADASVGSGWALYLAKIENAAPVFTKVAESGMDVDIDFAAIYNQSK